MKKPLQKAVCKLPPERRAGCLLPFIYMGRGRVPAPEGSEQCPGPGGAGVSPEICSKEPRCVSDAGSPLLLYLLVFQDKPENSFFLKRTFKE